MGREGRCDGESLKTWRDEGAGVVHRDELERLLEVASEKRGRFARGRPP
jgi:hypothetical protein